jgi:putative heme iron utilization protein
LSKAAATDARKLLLEGCGGILSTHSVDVPGYPFGSVVPYALDRQGLPVILISRIAQHTKNIKANPKVSLTVTQGTTDDIQASARLTYLADAARVPPDDEDTPARYYAYFPQSQDYHKVHDFDFYRLQPVRARYIGGFGDIHWVAPQTLTRPNPFSHEQETAMVQHMNEDHAEAPLRHYCQTAGASLDEGIAPVMAGIDGEGFHLRVGARIVRFRFDAPVATPAEVRQALVAMARR